MSAARLLLVLINLVAVFVLITSCSYKEDSHHEEPLADSHAAESAIRTASDDWAKAMTARDVEKTISFYADDGSYLPNRHSLIGNKDELRKFWAQLLAQPGPGFTCDTTRVEVARSGELGYETGTCELTTKDQQGKATTEKQKYVVVWRKQKDGSWKAVVDIDNTD